LLIVPLFGTGWWTYALGFAAFRLFDITKPGWVKRAEHAGPPWWSIHGDDLLAGLFAGLLVDAAFLLLRATGAIA
jgi:phosphatidylglycerophosphatase A